MIKLQVTKPKDNATRITVIASTALCIAAAVLATPAVAVRPQHSQTTVTALSIRPGVRGVVVNSNGHPLANLPIAVDGHTPSNHVVRFHAKTGSLGGFQLPPRSATFNAIRWTATAKFRWYGGTWKRDLETINNDASHLQFRADVGRYNSEYGVQLRVDDWDGCTSLQSDDPSFVATDPGTQSIKIHLAPVHRLVDGTTVRGGTVTIRSADLCGVEGVGHQIVAFAGAWKVTGVTNHRRRLAFSNHQGRGPYRRSLTVFNAPMPHGDHLKTIDVHFAS